MMFLAQAPNATGDQILTVLLGGAALAAIALIVKQLLPKRREPPIEAEFVSKSEHEKDLQAIVGDIAELRRKVDGDSRGIMVKLEETKTDLMMDGRRRSKELFQHIKDYNTEVFSRLNTQDKQIAALLERTEKKHG